eukprot:1157298-Pelagomonas_calceolata.AAC.9
MTPIDASVRFHSFQVCSSRNWPRAGDETIGGLLPKQATPSTSRRGVAVVLWARVPFHRALVCELPVGPVCALLLLLLLTLPRCRLRADVRLYSTGA